MASTGPATGDAPLWIPSAARLDSANLTAYVRWLATSRGRRFDDYESLWRWSIEELEEFWSSVWDYFDVRQSSAHRVALANSRMPGAEWFPGAKFNYSDQMLRHAGLGTPALIYYSEALGTGTLTWTELSRQAGALAKTLRSIGVCRGDRVAVYLPNVPHTLVAFLAVASLGAIWSLCAPEMGLVSVTDRFAQISAKVLITCDGYRFGGKVFDRSDTVAAILHALPSVKCVVRVPLLDSRSSHSLESATRQVISWDEATRGHAELNAEQVPFDHPLWIAYSSGSTGLPKGIVHGHGGALAIGLVMAGLHWDLKSGDVFFWHSSTGWIMWNIQAMALLMGSTICLYDGAVGGIGREPDLSTLWRFADEHSASFFGAGAAFFAECRKSGIRPGDLFGLRHLRSVGSTGSPLSPECYRWVYEAVKRDVWLLSTSGGTDITGSFLTGSPTLPVHLGEMQCRNLGAAVYAFDDHGHEVLDEVGELVCTKPMPCMPLYFWNDPEQERYIESYFDRYTGRNGERIWRHGDWLKLTTRPKAIGAIIYGRSDTTINRRGIRMGTAELYRIVEAHPDVVDSLVIDLEYLNRASYMALFVALRRGVELTEQLVSDLKDSVRTLLSSRHVPDEILQVEEIPRTLTGKKLELPIKKLLLGHPVDKVINRGAVANPASLDWYIAFAKLRLDAATECRT